MKSRNKKKRMLETETSDEIVQEVHHYNPPVPSTTSVEKLQSGEVSSSTLTTSPFIADLTDTPPSLSDFDVTLNLLDFPIIPSLEHTVALSDTAPILSSMSTDRVSHLTFDSNASAVYQAINLFDENKSIPS